MSRDQDPSSVLSPQILLLLPDLLRRGGRAMQISTPSYTGFVQCPRVLGCWKEEQDGSVLRKYLLHVALMGVLLAVGATEGGWDVWT